MPTTRKRTSAKETPVVTCANHPDTPAAHTTRSNLHQAISLCEDCLSHIGDYLRSR
jgi:hypothetical protein